MRAELLRELQRWKDRVNQMQHRSVELCGEEKSCLGVLMHRHHQDRPVAED